MKDFLRYRIEKELNIDENDSMFEDFLIQKLEQYGVSDTSQLNVDSKRDFFNDVVYEYRNGYSDETLIDENEVIEFFEDVLTNIAEALLDSQLSIDTIVEHISNELVEANLEIEVNVTELLENCSEVFSSLLNEDDNETYITLSDEALELFEAEHKDTAKFADAIKAHFKRHRGAYIGASLGSILASLKRTGAVKGQTAAGKAALALAGIGTGAFLGNRIDKKRAKKNVAAGKHADSYDV